MSRKLGLQRPTADDVELVVLLLQAMEGQDVDFTALFRRLSDAARGDAEGARTLFRDPAPFDTWLETWHARLAAEGENPEDRADVMDRVNPVYIPRNHKVQEALDAATAGDMEPFRRILAVLAQPFERRPGLEAYEQRAPEDFGPYRTFCGT